MILTETIVHHYHGAPWYQVVAIALLMLVVWELAWWSWHTLADWWRAWREEHGSTQVEDAADDRPECEVDGMCGTGRHTYAWPCVYRTATGTYTPSRDEAARAAERSET